MKNKAATPVWCYTKVIFILIVLSTFQIYAAEVLFPYKHEHACSSRLDRSCIRCNGIPECFDLSDETGCPNTTYKFIPIQKATKACRDKSCIKVFPEPPPLPPFSLCDRKLPTTKYTPESTTPHPAERTTFSHVTAKHTTQSPTTSQTTDQTTSRKCQTKRYPSTTQSQSRPTTIWWYRTTPNWPVVKTTTISPPWSTTQWIPTTTLESKGIFMKMWRFCAARYLPNRDIFSCTVNRFLRCYNSRIWPSCLEGISPIDNGVRAPTTVANSLFNAVPTQLFPIFPPATNTLIEQTQPRTFEDHYNSHRVTDNDVPFIFMLHSIFSK